jgi:hypothetical protein
MKAVTLTAAQQTQAKANATLVSEARAALVAAIQAEQAYLRTVAGASAPANAKVQLSDDGTMVIIG